MAKVIRVRLRPDRLNFPLAEAFVGQLSSAVFEIGGDVPDDIDGISVNIGRTDDPQTHEPRPDFAVAARAMGDGTFRCYCSPFCFPDVSSALKYHVMGLDSNGNARWLGTGELNVRACPADGSSIPPEIIPADTYIRNPVTGLYHKLTASVNDLGEVTIDLESEGIER